LVRDLVALEGADLVGLGRRGRQVVYEGFHLNSDNGSAGAYRAPTGTGDDETLKLPRAFFEQGWHLVLSPAEIAVLLMTLHATGKVAKPSTEYGIGIPRSRRHSVYGISGEAYGSIHHLEEFGLLTVWDPMPNRRAGKLRKPAATDRAGMEADGRSFAPVTYRLALSGLAAFDRPAFEVVREVLATSPLPERFSGRDLGTD
jgi:hypothetical protein